MIPGDQTERLARLRSVTLLRSPRAEFCVGIRGSSSEHAIAAQPEYASVESTFEWPALKEGRKQQPF